MSNRSKTVISNIEELTFGVEIETNIPAIPGLSIGGYHSGQSIAYTTAPQFQGTSWKAERDGSIIVKAAGHQACEFVSPILKGAQGVAHLMEFVAWLNRVGAVVNSSCGLHIHVGVLPLAGQHEHVVPFVNKLARVAAFNATALYAQTGTISREQGHFCQKPNGHYKKSVARACRQKGVSPLSDVGRYQMLNLTTVNHRGTVEFRCFAGTLNINKILVHLFSVLCLCRVAQKLSSVPNWENKNLNGSQSVKNLLRVRPVFAVVSAQSFYDNRKPMLAKAFEMAAKYDAAKAAASPSVTVNQ